MGSTKEVRTYLETICPQYNSCSEFWTGRIAFHLSKNISGGDYEKISKLLYRTLYEDLIAFGVKKNTSFLCLTMPLVEHLSIDMLGLWPDLMKIRPCESSDGLFHGLLSLAGEMHPSSDFWQLEDNEGAENYITLQKRPAQRQPMIFSISLKWGLYPGPENVNILGII